jgi:hypothetical protein
MKPQMIIAKREIIPKTIKIAANQLNIFEEGKII